MTRTRGTYVQPTDSDLYAPYRTAHAIADNGHRYLICTEGVGRMQEDGTTVTAIGDPVDLADWIRTFGARLESNFGLWYRTLTATDHTDCNPDDCPDSPYNDPDRLCPDCTGQGCDTCEWSGLR